MIDTQFAAYAAPVALVGAFALRSVFARVAMSSAIKAAQPDLDKFYSFAENQIAPLTTQQAQGVAAFEAVMDASYASRQTRMQRFDNVKMSEKDAQERTVVMREIVFAAGEAVALTALVSGSIRISNVLASDAHLRMARHAGETVAAPVVNIVDAKISAALDQIGVTDKMTYIMEHLPHVHVTISPEILHTLEIPACHPGYWRARSNFAIWPTVKPILKTRLFMASPRR